MRVLQVHTRYRLAGGEDVVVDQERALLSSGGHDVELFTAENPDGAKAAGRLLLSAPWNPAAARQVVAAARAHRADIVHVHNTWFALSPAVLPALGRAGFPTVVTLHNYRTTCANAVLLRDGRPCYDCVGHSPLPGVVHRCYRGSAAVSAVAAATITVGRRSRAWQEHADALVVLSPHAQELFTRSGLPAERMHVVPHVMADVPLRTFPPSQSTACLYVGRLSPEKGVAGLLRDWQQVRPQGLTLDVIGTGPEEQRLRDAAGEGVQLLGHLGPDEVLERVRQARALLVPSLWDEMFGRVVLEAFAVGTPVLAADRGGPADLLTAAGLPDWLVPDGAWAGALADLADGELATSADAASVAVRRHYDSELTPERGLRRLEAVYDAARARRG